jgi:hypothetical protein
MNTDLTIAQQSVLDQLPELGITERLVPAVRKVVAAAMTGMALAASAPALAEDSIFNAPPSEPAVRYESTATGSDVAKGAGIGAFLGGISAKLMGKPAPTGAAVGAAVGGVGVYAAKSEPVVAHGRPAKSDPAPGTRQIESSRLGQFNKLAEGFDQVQSDLKHTQKQIHEEELDATLNGSKNKPYLDTLTGIQQKLTEKRNSLGKQFLTSYAKAVDLGYDMTPVEPAAQRIFAVMKTAEPKTYSSIRDQASGYIARLNSAYRPR